MCVCVVCVLVTAIDNICITFMAKFLLSTRHEVIIWRQYHYMMHNLLKILGLSQVLFPFLVNILHNTLFVYLPPVLLT